MNGEDSSTAGRPQSLSARRRVVRSTSRLTPLPQTAAISGRSAARCLPKPQDQPTLRLLLWSCRNVSRQCRNVDRQCRSVSSFGTPPAKRTSRSVQSAAISFPHGASCLHSAATPRGFVSGKPRIVSGSPCLDAKSCNEPQNRVTLSGIFPNLPRIRGILRQSVLSLRHVASSLRLFGETLRPGRGDVRLFLIQLRLSLIQLRLCEAILRQIRESCRNLSGAGARVAGDCGKGGPSGLRGVESAATRAPGERLIRSLGDSVS